MNILQLQTEIKQLFVEHQIESGAFETGCILHKVFDCDRQWLMLNRSTQCTAEQIQQVRTIATKRISGYPLQYLMGSWEFYGLEFSVGEGVLIPRADTERLCEVGIEQVGQRNCTVIDLCSGSGCIAVTIKKNCPNAIVYAVELSKQALPYLHENIKQNQTDITVVEGDVLSNQLIAQLPDCDAILSNPPYLTKTNMEQLQKEVQFEPKTALYGHPDGLHFYREITKLWKQKLKPNGLLAFEIGINQEQDVKDILRQNDFHHIQFAKDIHNIIRVVYAHKGGYNG